MGRKKPLRPVVRRPTEDSFSNAMSKLGWGTENQSSGAGYSLTYQSRNRVELEAAYRGSWIVRKAVDAIPEDMTRSGIEIAGLEPDVISKLERTMTILNIWERICDTAKWARLYGGAVAVMMIEGQDMATPLRPESVGRGQFKGLIVLDRWMLNPPITEIVTDFGPEFGKPAFYTVNSGMFGLPGNRIHHSRVIRLEGEELPYFQRVSENGWGLSVLETIWDRLIAFDSATVGAGQLTYKAHLRVLKIEGLREIIASGGPQFEGIRKQIEFTRFAQTNEGMTVLDSTDDFSTHQYAFSGLADVLIQFGQQLAGALGIPLTRLFGQAPAGMNATGESDMQMYYDTILQHQERHLRNPMHRLLNLLYMSVFGQTLPDDFAFEFRNLKQMTEVEKSQILGTTVTAVTAAHEAGLVSTAQAMRELKASAPSTGAFGDIPEADIEAAEAMAPPGGELPLPGMPPELVSGPVPPDRVRPLFGK